MSAKETILQALRTTDAANTSRCSYEWAAMLGVSKSYVYQLACKHNLLCAIEPEPQKHYRGLVSVRGRKDAATLAAYVGGPALCAAGLEHEKRLAFTVEAGRIILSKVEEVNHV